MSDHATGAWMPAGRVARAAQARVEQIRDWRVAEREKEARRLMPAKPWRPWRISEARARRRVERCGFARYWWSTDEERAWEVMNLARAVSPDKTVFVSAKDFKCFSKVYGETQ